MSYLFSNRGSWSLVSRLLTHKKSRPEQNVWHVSHTPSQAITKDRGGQFFIGFRALDRHINGHRIIIFAQIM